MDSGPYHSFYRCVGHFGLHGHNINRGPESEGEGGA
jgi:hypothetical protein